MTFQALGDAQRAALDAYHLARATRDRAALSRHLAETRLHFLGLAAPLLDGDPWLLTQPPVVQAAYRAHHGEASGFEYNRLSEALFWLDESETQLDDHWSTVTGGAEDRSRR